jgi:CRISPR/Cas system-associated protein Cas10 (large subunit of type III CRISPR-Cas system)
MANPHRQKTCLPLFPLHDIGKPVQRSKGHLREFRIPLTKHPKIGATFIKGLKDKLNLETVQRLIENHHNPQKLDEKLIQLSDWLSAGERVTEEDIERAAPGNFRLLSIFSSLFENEESVIKKYYKVSKLSFDSIFPDEDSKTQLNEYDNLLDNFVSELDDLKDFNFAESLFPNPLLDKIYFLLEKYFWAVPAQTPFPTSKNPSLTT